MTEQDWLACDDPRRMLEFLIGHDQGNVWVETGYRVDERKLRLFACASARLKSDLSERNRNSIEQVEALEMAHYDYTQIDPLLGLSSPLDWARHHAAKPEDRQKRTALVRDIFGNPFRPVASLRQHRVSFQGQTDLSYPSWLTWNDGLVRKLAQTIYDERAFERIPILADALEEAGCTNEDILRHCRGYKRCVQCPENREDGCPYCPDGWVEDWWLRTPSPTPPLHVRGCWVVDLLLGK